MKSTVRSSAKVWAGMLSEALMWPPAYSSSSLTSSTRTLSRSGLQAARRREQWARLATGSRLRPNPRV